MHAIDLAVFHLINDWCGTPVLDWLAEFADKNVLVKGGLIMAAYWWFWFPSDPQKRQHNRGLIAAVLIGTLVALVICRGLASELPFRIRPRYMVDIGYHAPSIPIQMNQENWSAFPSDHAALFFALVIGLFYLSRPIGVIACAFTFVWICMVRVYLGIHYPSDLLVGALIGVLCVWAAARPIFSEWLGRKILWLENRFTNWFYTLAFLLTFEIASIFQDVRQAMRGTYKALSSLGYGGNLFSSLVILVIGLVVIAGVWLLVLYLNKRHSRLMVDRSVEP